MEGQTRQLAAIMFTDIVGYVKLMGEDEENAFEAGYSFFDFVESSSHYHSLRNDEEFRALISKFRNQETP